MLVWTVHTEEEAAEVRAERAMVAAGREGAREAKRAQQREQAAERAVRNGERREARPPRERVEPAVSVRHV